MRITFKEQIKRSGILFSIYTLTVIIGACINALPKFLSIRDTDGYGIFAHIITNVYGFCNGIMGYGDFFEYSGFNATPFVIGGSIWVIIGIIFSKYLQGENKGKKYRKISNFLLWFGSIMGLGGSLFSYIIALSGNGFALLLIPLLATISLPIIFVGLVLKKIGKNK